MWNYFSAIYKFGLFIDNNFDRFLKEIGPGSEFFFLNKTYPDPIEYLDPDPQPWLVYIDPHRLSKSSKKVTMSRKETFMVNW